MPMAVELTGLNRTLLMPLWGRAKATAAGSRILRDSTAVELADRLGADDGAPADHDHRPWAIR